MSLERENQFGKLNISTSVITEITANAAMECYGVVGMASNKAIKDGIAELLNRENYSRGIEIVQTKDNEIVVDINVVIANDIKISEIAMEIQKKVKYILENTLEVDVKSVNVHIKDIKVIS